MLASVERILVYEVVENLVEHCKHCLPCSTKFSMTLYSLSCFYANDVTELNDWRKMICLRKIKIFVERILIYKVIENLVEHGRRCLSCSTKISMTLFCVPCF